MDLFIMLYKVVATSSESNSQTVYSENLLWPCLDLVHMLSWAPYLGTKMDVVQTRQCPELTLFINN